jgi:hypothetical protein
VASSPSDPNTQHQVWFKWVFVIHAYPDLWMVPPFELVQNNCLQWFKKLCAGGSALFELEQFALPGGTQRYVVTLRWDRADAVLPDFRQAVLHLVTRFFQTGLGEDAQVKLRDCALQAGTVENQREQMLVLPHRASEAMTLWGA